MKILPSALIATALVMMPDTVAAAGGSPGQAAAIAIIGRGLLTEAKNG